MDVRHVDSESPDPAAVDEAAATILRGGVIAFPSDTLYGLACSLYDTYAVETIARLKRRGVGHAVISLIPEPSQAEALAAHISPLAGRLIREYWPGPLSLIFAASGLVPKAVQGAGGTIALRCPKDTLSHALLVRIGGPVVSSSANVTGQAPAETADEVVRVFGNQLDLVLDGGPRRGHLSSTLVDVSGPRPRLLRQGALDVRARLGDHEDLSGRT